jgi:hypothetical protein
MQNKGSLKVLLGFSIVTVLLFSQTASVAAVNDQGLVWGVEVNNRFDYNVKLEFQNSTTNVSIDDRMYMIVNELTTIPDHVTLLSHITIFSLVLGSYTTYWENGTIMDNFWLDIMEGTNPLVVYPIGNWSLLAQIFEASAPVVITQNSTVMNNSLVDFPVLGNVHETIFLKSSGVVYSNLYIRTYDSETTIHMNLTMIQTPTNTGVGDSTLIIIVGGGALAAVVIVMFIIRRK